jgi:hypothetical protein
MPGLPGDVEASDVLPLLHGLYWLTAMTRSTRVSVRSGKAAKSLASLLPASRMTASSEKTAATASGSWAFQAAYVASFTSRARAR